MHYSKVLLAAAFAAGVFADTQGNKGNMQGGANAAAGNDAGGRATTGGNNAALTLDPAAVQTGSAADGTGAVGAEAGQAKSQTSTNNFINFCAGKTLTNGL